MNEIFYNSTRGQDNKVSASQAIINGLAGDGGLYVPDKMPELKLDFEEIKDLSYQELACRILSAFLTDFSRQEIEYCVHSAYDQKFDCPEIAPTVKRGDSYYLELFHGSTIAFKDMALSILPYLMKVAAKKQQIKDTILILTATSGDTGKAALEGFSDVEGIEIVVFYPKDGVSKIQERQMITSAGKNTLVVGIDGNFDDAQTGVKQIFGDAAFRADLATAGYRLSSANSINIGRLLPQIVYYIYSYAQLVRQGHIQSGELIDFAVPTGNFGNILAGHYAKRLGTPINKLICCSNDNKVLYDFINSGRYDIGRDFKLTISPSMDILVSSNLERFIYELSDNDSNQVKTYMNQLAETGSYQIPISKLDQDLVGGYATEQETLDTIKRVFEQDDYVLDPHTAVAKAVYDKYWLQAKPKHCAVIVSTASPYKFTNSVIEAMGYQFTDDEFGLIDKLHQISDIPIPPAVDQIAQRPVLHNYQSSKEEIKQFLYHQKRRGTL